MLLIAAVLWEMAAFTPDVSKWTLIRTGVLQGLGLGFMFVLLSAITFATPPGHLRIQRAALYSLVRNLGSSIGISPVIFLLTREGDAGRECDPRIAGRTGRYTGLRGWRSWLTKKSGADFSAPLGLSEESDDSAEPLKATRYINPYVDLYTHLGPAHVGAF